MKATKLIQILSISRFNFGVQRTCTIGKCPGIHIMVVLRNTECGVEEHRMQAYNEVVWAITRSVRVQPFYDADYGSSQFRSRRIYPQKVVKWHCYPIPRPSKWLSEWRALHTFPRQPTRGYRKERWYLLFEIMNITKPINVVVSMNSWSNEICHFVVMMQNIPQRRYGHAMLCKKLDH